jgi:hypothetical protein
MSDNVNVFCINCAKEIELLDGGHWHHPVVIELTEVFLCGPECWDEWFSSPEREWVNGEVVA